MLRMSTSPSSHFRMIDMTRDELIAAVRAAAAKRGTTRLTSREFRAAANIGERRIQRHFTTWRELCAAAGLDRVAHPGRVPDETLFEAMRDAFVACGGIVRRPLFQRQFRYGPSILDRRFGAAWDEILAAFAGWIETSATDFPTARSSPRRSRRGARRGRRSAT
jgi:hypothetical protein